MPKPKKPKFLKKLVFTPTFYATFLVRTLQYFWYYQTLCGAVNTADLVAACSIIDKPQGMFFGRNNMTVFLIKFTSSICWYWFSCWYWSCCCWYHLNWYCGSCSILGNWMKWNTISNGQTVGCKNFLAKTQTA